MKWKISNPNIEMQQTTTTIIKTRTRHLGSLQTQECKNLVLFYRTVQQHDPNASHGFFGKWEVHPILEVALAIFTLTHPRR